MIGLLFESRSWTLGKLELEEPLVLGTKSDLAIDATPPTAMTAEATTVVFRKLRRAWSVFSSLFLLVDSLPNLRNSYLWGSHALTYMLITKIYHEDGRLDGFLAHV